MLKNTWLALALTTLFCLASPQSSPAITLLIHPYQTSTELHQKFSPLANYLEKAIGQKIVVKISQDCTQQIEAVGKDQTDMAYMGPNEYVTMTKQYGLKPLLACQEVNGKTSLNGMMVVKSDSPLHNLSELSGKRVAFVSPQSTMGYVLPRLMLREAGVDIKQLAKADFIKSHSNVALAVLNGYYEAGAVKDEAFAEYQGRGLRVLAACPPVHEHVFVANPHLSDTMIASLRKALQNLHEPAVLNAIESGLSGLVAVKDSDYDSLRQLLDASPP